MRFFLFLKQVEKIICNLRPALKLRLRFITHISKMEPAAVSQQPLSSGSPAQQPSQVPVNVALPVTQWNEVRGWPWREGFLLLLTKGSSVWSEIWMLYKRIENHTDFCVDFFCIMKLPRSVHASFLYYLCYTVDKGYVAFLWKHWVKILYKQIHGFMKSLPYSAPYPGLSHLDFPLFLPVIWKDSYCV